MKLICDMVVLAACMLFCIGISLLITGIALIIVKLSGKNNDI